MSNAMTTLAKAGSLALLLGIADPALAQEQAAPVPVETNKDGVQLEIVDIRRTGDEFLTLRLRMRNESGRNISFYDVTDQLLEYVTVHDIRNRRKHLTVKDGSGHCLCGGDSSV